MTSSTLTFLMFAGAVGLAAWRPEAGASRALRMVMVVGLAWLSVVALLAALFTVWWPPTHGWAVAWSAAATAVLAGVVAANAAASD